MAQRRDGNHLADETVRRAVSAVRQNAKSTLKSVADFVQSALHAPTA